MPRASEAASTNDEALKNKLYSEALRELRESHRAEFDALVTTKFEAVGLTYRKRLSSEERARANIERIAKEAGVFVSFDPPSPVAVEQAD